VTPLRNFVQSLSRGLSILSVLAESSSPLNLTEISHQLRLSKSTIQRLTFTLLQLGYLNRDKETKKFRLGPKVLSLGFAVIRSLDLKEMAYPYLEETSREVGETVNLAVLDGTEIVYVERILVPYIPPFYCDPDLPKFIQISRISAEGIKPPMVSQLLRNKGMGHRNIQQHQSCYDDRHSCLSSRNPSSPNSIKTEVQRNSIHLFLSSAAHDSPGDHCGDCTLFPFCQTKVAR